MSLSNICAEKLHQAWAMNKRKQIDPKTNKPFTQVWKDTGDDAYDNKMLELISNGKKPEYVKVENGQVKIDILNMPYKELSNKWKGENLEAGISIEEILGLKGVSWLNYIATFKSLFGVNFSGMKSSKGDVENYDYDKIEKYAKRVHDRWKERREQERKKNPDAWIDESLMVPYEELSEEEKMKDRVHVLLAMEILRVMNKGIVLDYMLDKAYGDRPVFTPDGRENYATNPMMASVLYANVDKFTEDEIEILESLFGKNNQTVRYAKTRLEKKASELEK